jgi:hypothetical protein
MTIWQFSGHYMQQMDKHGKAKRYVSATSHREHAKNALCEASALENSSLATKELKTYLTKENIFKKSYLFCSAS